MELIIEDITKKYGDKRAVDGLSLKLTEGVYGLLGANGAGKTTLIRMMCSVLKSDSGHISLDGLSPDSGEYRGYLGYLPQHFGYYPEFSAIDFMEYMGTLKGIPKKEARDTAYHLMEEVGLKGLEKKKIKTYSGGMKQRLGIAQAIMNQPRLLVLDEPTAGLDPKERVRFRNLISSLGKDRIVLLSTHIVSDVESIAKEILVMKEGKLLHQGTRDELIGTIEGKIWECGAQGQEVQILEERYTIINMRQEGSSQILRLVSECAPTEGAVQVKANLEDLYIYYFNDEEERA